MREWLRRLLRARPANEAEELADRYILVAKQVGAKSPREAMTICMGRPVTDEEWDRYSEAWVRRWY